MAPLECPNKRWSLHKGNQDENCHCQTNIWQNNITYHSWQASQTLNSRRNWLGVMFGALYYVAQWSGNYEYFRTEIFEELWNVVLEENGEDKIIRESNKWPYAILHRKPNWISHILRRNYLRHDAFEKQKSEVKGLGRTRTQVRFLMIWETEKDIGS